MMVIKLSDYTEFPGPRYVRLGPFSGEWFREDVLLKTIKDNSGEFIVDLDGTVGYGSSFLEEAFGGLIRAGVNPDIALSICKNIRSHEDESLPLEITGYVEDAIRAKK